MYLQINHLFSHEKALTVAQKHTKLVELALNKSLGLWSKIVCAMLIRGVVTFYDRLSYLCPTVFSALATPLPKGPNFNNEYLWPNHDKFACRHALTHS